MRRALFLGLLLGACGEPPAYVTPPAITSEVEDWRDEVIYQLIVDRFANGDANNDHNVSRHPDVLSRYMGGDYQGVIDHVDYLVELGVTAVWISPAVVNVEEDAGVASYHGYWTQDFKGVNPHFGDMAKLREMVDVLHAHGIKVVLDIVVNHVGQLFYYDINRNGQPDTTIYGSGSQDPSNPGDDPLEVITEWDPAYDARGVQGWTSLGESGLAPLGWVYMPELNRLPPEPAVFHNDAWYNRRGRVTDWDEDEQVVRGDFPGGLKDLDTSNPEVVAALIDVFTWWIDQTNLDGFRIDTVKHVEHGFWVQFCAAMREHAAAIGKANFFMFGEAFDGRDDLIGSYTQPGELDSVVYFSQKFRVYDDVYQRGGPTSAVEALLAERRENYGAEPQPGGVGLPPTDVLVNFIDNHDIPRFLFGQPEEEALEVALVHLFTQDGIPCLYYGTEQGFAGGNDPANREPLWASAYDVTSPLFQHTRSLAALRKSLPALRRGDMVVRWASDRVSGEEDAHMLAFERWAGDDGALVVLNTGGEGRAHTRFEGSDMAVGFSPGQTLRVVWPEGDDRTFRVSGSGTLRVELDPWTAVVLAP